MKCNIADVDLEELSDALQILSQSIRLKIICMLDKQEELCVCEIVEQLDIAQNLISHHLSMLKRIGIVKTRRKGVNIHYSLNQEVYEKLRGELKCVFSL